MARPHAASIIEDAWNHRVVAALRARGWATRVVPFAGYGSAGMVRVLGRVKMSRQPVLPSTDDTGPVPLRAFEEDTRGWRAFVGTPPVADSPVTVTVNGRSVTARSDRSGLIDLTVRGHGLTPGWHTVLISTPSATPVEAPVLIIGTRQRFGVVSDIDDTVLSTSLPRPMIAAWNTFVRTEGSRREVPGMATLYREIAANHPGMPFIYLSTGAWNTQPWLVRFLRRGGYPAGPMLLTDWGPTNTGWFRSGQDHKRSSLHRLARELPHVQWLLIGDDGQHDPKLYTEFAAARPDAVIGIAIRQLSAGQQVLSHGIPVPNDDLAPAPTEDLSVPVLRAPDGFSLARLLRPLFERRAPHPHRIGGRMAGRLRTR